MAYSRDLRLDPLTREGGLEEEESEWVRTVRRRTVAAMSDLPRAGQTVIPTAAMSNSQLSQRRNILETEGFEDVLSAVGGGRDAAATLRNAYLSGPAAGGSLGAVERQQLMRSRPSLADVASSMSKALNMFKAFTGGDLEEANAEEDRELVGARISAGTLRSNPALGHVPGFLPRTSLETDSVGERIRSGTLTSRPGMNLDIDSIEERIMSTASLPRPYLDTDSVRERIRSSNVTLDPGRNLDTDNVGDRIGSRTVASHLGTYLGTDNVGERIRSSTVRSHPGMNLDTDSVGEMIRASAIRSRLAGSNLPKMYLEEPNYRRNKVFEGDLEVLSDEDDGEFVWVKRRVGTGAPGAAKSSLKPEVASLNSSWPEREEFDRKEKATPKKLHSAIPAVGGRLDAVERLQPVTSKRVDTTSRRLEKTAVPERRKDDSSGSPPRRQEGASERRQPDDTRSRRSHSPNARSHRSRSPNARSRRSRSPIARSRQSRNPNARSRRSQSPNDARRHRSRSPNARSRRSRSPYARRLRSRSPYARSRRSRSPNARSRQSRSPNDGRRRRSRSPPHREGASKRKQPDDAKSRQSRSPNAGTRRSRSPNDARRRQSRSPPRRREGVSERQQPDDARSRRSHSSTHRREGAIERKQPDDAKSRQSRSPSRQEGANERPQSVSAQPSRDGIESSVGHAVGMHRTLADTTKPVAVDPKATSQVPNKLSQVPGADTNKSSTTGSVTRAQMSWKNTRKQGKICPISRCGIPIKKLRKHVRQHFPEYFKHTEVASEWVKFAKVRVTGLRLIAQFLVGEGSTLDDLVDFVNANWQHDRSEILESEYREMHFMIKEVSLPNVVPILEPINTPAALCHWQPLAFLYDRLTKQQEDLLAMLGHKALQDAVDAAAGQEQAPKHDDLPERVNATSQPAASIRQPPVLPERVNAEEKLAAPTGQPLVLSKGVNPVTEPSVPAGQTSVWSKGVNAVTVPAVPAGQNPVWAKGVNAVTVPAVPAGQNPVWAKGVNAVTVPAEPAGQTPVWSKGVNAVTLPAAPIGQTPVWSKGVNAVTVPAAPTQQIPVLSKGVNLVTVPAAPAGQTPVWSKGVNAVTVPAAPIGQTPVWSKGVNAVTVPAAPIGQTPVWSKGVNAVTVPAAPTQQIPVLSKGILKNAVTEPSALARQSPVLSKGVNALTEPAASAGQTPALLWGFDALCFPNQLLDKMRESDRNQSQKHSRKPDREIHVEGGVKCYCDPQHFARASFDDFLDRRRLEATWRIAVGILPKMASWYLPPHWESLVRHLAHPRVTAISTGLDFTVPKAQWNAQEMLFNRVLTNGTLEHVLVLHLEGEPTDYLGHLMYQHVFLSLTQKCSPQQRIQLHCFAGDSATVKGWTQAFPNCYFGITSLVRKFNLDQLQALKEIPLNRLLLESDSPYGLVHPEQDYNTPSFLGDLGQLVADARGVSLAAIMSATTLNGLRLHKSK